MNRIQQRFFLISFCALFFAAGCSEQSGKQAASRAEAEPATESEAATKEEVKPVSLEEALSNESRASTDLARDAGRKPAEVMAFLGVSPGMTAIDLLAANGYYTEVLSLAVGDEGKVYAHNTGFLLKMRDGANDKAMAERLAHDRLSNVVRLDEEFENFSVEAGTVDVAITALNFHDIYNNGGSDDAQGVLTVVRNILKPGGVLGIIDHVGSAGADNKKMHRIDPAVIREEATKAGYEIDGESDLLANPEDKHDSGVFGEYRGKTDRLLIRLRKPEE
jgi:predicted methyltransferase